MDGLGMARMLGAWGGEMGSGGPCQELQGRVTLASGHWKGLGTGGPETGLSPLARAHLPLSRPPVKVSALGGQREALLCKGKAILNNSSVSQEGEKPMGYGIAPALNYTVGG